MKRTLDGIKYDHIDPTGNITILVESEVAPEDYAGVAKRLMEHERTCEQVGFVMASEKADTRLNMAAGEFCGNATMSAAALFAHDHPSDDKSGRTVSVETAAGIIEVYITSNDGESPGSYRGRLKMPVPQRIITKRFEFGGTVLQLPVVEFDGISHIICKKKKMEADDEDIIKTLKVWWEDMRTPCLGLMLTGEETFNGENELTVRLRPLVYAPDVDTCYWESSCASGTTALAAYHKMEPGQGELILSAHEPAGILKVICKTDGSLMLEGNVRL